MRTMAVRIFRLCIQILIIRIHQSWSSESLWKMMQLGFWILIS